MVKPELLLLDGDPSVNVHVPRLRESFDVTTDVSFAAATAFLRRTASNCQFVISDILANGEETFELFRTAKSLATPPTILVTTADVDRVPDALISGGDEVLLKPFAPNLLFARLGRLKQERVSLRGRFAATDHSAGIQCPQGNCPYCNATPITSFDFVSHGRAWYACLACKKVWIAKRLDQ